ncbi:MAG TPA: hypothetical protein VK186_20165 [Candidatus Deferrimicrobium sp.]|nr:hypothetical protein [Candidatus Kapabacteria bacterium]HLP61168.1 hypothetical protein [Candidatus Deferrimicrobium sp.]
MKNKDREKISCLCLFLSYPANLSLLTGKESPQTLHAIGDITILNKPLSALFCSVRCSAGQ